MALDIYKALGSGGLTTNKVGSNAVQGPGLGYAGPTDYYKPQPSKGVLGAATTSVSNNRAVAQPQSQPQPQQQQQQVDPYAQLKAEISSGWDNYLNQIGGLESGLGDQRTAQENIANTQYDQGVNAIQTQQAKSLRDIGSNISNAFQAGNVYLGSRGAGDSSAANQYQFALAKEGSKQTANLNDYVNGQMNSLKSTHDTQVNQIAQWFAEQQNAIKQMVANGQLQKSQDIQNLSRDILNQALAAKQQIQTDSTNRYNALVEWAANNSQNISQLQSNIAQIPSVFGTPQMNAAGGFAVPVGAGTSNTADSKLNFQNPSWF